MVEQQKKQIRLSFTLEPSSRNENELIEWLEAKTPTLRRKKVMQAIRGFWKGIAAMEQGKSPELVRRAGLNCCKELECQLISLKATLFLPLKEIESDYHQTQFNEPNSLINWNQSVNGATPWTFSYQPSESSPDFELVSWLKTTVGNHDKIMLALSAYWLAIAAMERKTLSPQQIKMLGLNCCSMLESQLDYIRAVLELPSKSVVTVVGSQQDKGASVPEGTFLGGASKTEKVIKKKIEEEYENNREIERDFLKFE